LDYAYVKPQLVRLYEKIFKIIFISVFIIYLLGVLGEMGRIDEQDFDEKRLARRQRRKRSQLIAYILLSVLLIIVIIGGVFGANYITKVVNANKAVKLQQEEEAAAALEASQNVVIETPQDTAMEPQEMTQGDVLDEIVNSCIGELSIEDKVAGLFMITPEQLTGVETVIKAGSSTQDALSRYAIGGLVYASKNIKSNDQIIEMLRNTGSMSKYPVFTAIKEDGTSSGCIQASLGGIEIPDINSSDAAYTAGTNIAAAMFKYGFNLNFAPDLDISENGKYGTDKDVASDITAAFASALSDSGIIACVHDFPVSADTASGMAIDESGSEQLATGAYSIYKNAFENGNVKAVMLSNVSIPNVVGDNTPVSLSSVMIQDELRGVLGFDGIVITGPLNQKAITENYSPAEAAVNAIAAGADMIYLPEDFSAAYQGLLEAVENGKITEDRLDESLRRIYRLKYQDRVDDMN
jgi:beta-N-acetylhexosaminidase